MSAMTGEVELARFGDGAALLPRVNDKQCASGSARHAFKAAEHALEVCGLAVDEQALALGELGYLAAFVHVGNFAEAIEALFNFSKVGERAAYPARRDVGLAYALGGALERFARFGFAADKKDGLALRGHLFDKLERGLKAAAVCSRSKSSVPPLAPKIKVEVTGAGGEAHSRSARRLKTACL